VPRHEPRHPPRGESWGLEVMEQRSCQVGGHGCDYIAVLNNDLVHPELPPGVHEGLPPDFHHKALVGPEFTHGECPPDWHEMADKKHRQEDALPSRRVRAGFCFMFTEVSST